MTDLEQNPAPARRADVDEDRGIVVGAAVALTLTFLAQALLVVFYQLATRGEGELMGPVRFGGFTQLMYIAPTALLFVNRKCPRMAAGVGAVAGVVFLVNVIWIIAT